MPQMPPVQMTSNPLSAMLGIQRRQAPMVNLEADRIQRQREMLRNMEMAKGNPNMAVGATPSDVIGLQSDIEEDPYTGEAADEEAAYNQPFATSQREMAKQDALERLLAPIQERNRGAMDVARVGAEGRIGAAEAAGAQRGVAAQQAQSARASQAQTAARNRYQGVQNAGLEKQAVAREKQGGYDFWNSMLGRQTNAQREAATLRGGIVQPGGPAPMGDGGGDQAAQMFAEAPDASAEQVAAYLQSQGVTDPQEIAATIVAYQQLQGRR